MLKCRVRVEGACKVKADDEKYGEKEKGWKHPCMKKNI